MITLIGVCISIITVAIVIGVVYLVGTLIQVRRTAAEIEICLKQVNHEVLLVQGITERVSSVFKTISSPIGLLGGLVSGVLSAWIAKRHARQAGRP